MRKFIIAAFILLNISSCGSSVSYKVAPNYQTKIPRYIAVLPARGEDAESDARYLLRIMTQEKLSQLNYNLMPLEMADDRLIKANIGRKEFLAMPPAEIAGLLGVDAVVYITITTWKTRFFISYASIDMEARFEMYTANTGEKIWTAEYEHNDSDISIDRETLKFKITKIYEPVIQKIVDAAFLTLPSATDEKKYIQQDGGGRKQYFEWLK